MKKWTTKNSVELIGCIISCAIVEGFLSYLSKKREIEDKHMTEESIKRTE